MQDIRYKRIRYNKKKIYIFVWKHEGSCEYSQILACNFCTSISIHNHSGRTDTKKVHNCLTIRRFLPVPMVLVEILNSVDIS